MPKSLHGSLFNKSFEIAALIIGVVYSGLNVNESLFLSKNVYISFNTTSLCSPNGFEKSSVNSKIGVSIF